MANKILRSIPKYGDHGTGDVRILQQALGILDDDWFGDDTLKALQKFQKSKGMPGTGVIPADGGKTLQLLEIEFIPAQESGNKTKPPSTDNYFGAPWVGVLTSYIGRTEDDPELNKILVPEWKKEGLSYTTLAGNSHAWCSVKENYEKRQVGVKGTDSAASASWRKWGYKSPFWFGCTLPIKHQSGDGHVATFLYWINEAKQIAAQYGGNQGNKLSIVANDVSGKKDLLPAGPRWSNDRPDGLIVSMEQVLSKYPFLKVGSTGGSTR